MKMTLSLVHSLLKMMPRELKLGLTMLLAKVPLFLQEEREMVHYMVSIAPKHVLTVIDATIVENVPQACDLNCKEVFGYDYMVENLIYFRPVLNIHKFSSFKEAVKLVNDSDFGLQTGVYTQNIHKAFYAFEQLHVGGVLINDIPSARVDSQPVRLYIIYN